MSIKSKGKYGLAKLKGLISLDNESLAQDLTPKITEWTGDYMEAVVLAQGENALIKSLKNHPIGTDILGMLIGHLNLPKLVEPMVNGSWVGVKRGLKKKGQADQHKKQLSDMESVFKKVLRDQLGEAVRRGSSEPKSTGASPSPKVQDDEFLAGFSADGPDGRIQVHFKQCPKGLRAVIKEKKGHKCLSVVTAEDVEREGWSFAPCCARLKESFDKLRKVKEQPGLTREEAQALVDEALTGIKEQAAAQNVWTKLAPTEEQRAAFSRGWAKAKDVCVQHVIPASAGAYEAVTVELTDKALKPLESWGKSQRAKAEELHKVRVEAACPPPLDPMPGLGHDLRLAMRGAGRFLFGRSRPKQKSALRKKRKKARRAAARKKSSLKKARERS